MNKFSFDKYLNVVNEEKVKQGLELYVGVMLTNDNDDVWDKNSVIKPEYWSLVDIDSEKLVSFDKTSEKDFVNGEVIPKVYDNVDKEISKYTIEKTMQYKEYFKNDLLDFKVPLQKKLAEVLGDDIEIDGEKVNLNEYAISIIADEANEKIDDLVKMLVWNKYGSIIFYYDMLHKQIIEEYKKGNINKEKLKLCAEIMNNYYPGVNYIDNFFNI
jgi:hypothetical protein